ncbi:MAG TPA: hypothetical protein VHD69_01480 [Candidatus Paceibacterota bacterium]|jgi:hypothetical protein|nr:hypothetical protein [Candidatus Paceibacterota bacterium]
MRFSYEIFRGFPAPLDQVAHLYFDRPIAKGELKLYELCDEPPQNIPDLVLDILKIPGVLKITVTEQTVAIQRISNEFPWKELCSRIAVVVADSNQVLWSKLEPQSIEDFCADHERLVVHFYPDRDE